MVKRKIPLDKLLSLPSREAWIEIFLNHQKIVPPICRFPRGKRGLKFCVFLCAVPSLASLPSREAWIEMTMPTIITPSTSGRFPRGKRGLKLEEMYDLFEIKRSLPPREAWIEISHTILWKKRSKVASPAGSVD